MASDAFELVRFEDDPSPSAVGATADAIVAIEPSPTERGLIDEIDLPTLIWLKDASPGESGAPRANQRLIASSCQDERIWRSAPLPVADRHYGNDAQHEPWQAAWLGPSTPRRRDHLAYFKGDPDLIADDLSISPPIAIAVNMHDDEGPGCEHRALSALARGKLLVSEPLTPPRGLEPGIDYVEAHTLDDMFLAVEHAIRSPSSLRRVRLRGRRKAELFRASRVIPRLVGDLLLELEAGDPRRRHSSS